LNYPARAEKFTSIVKQFLDGRFHADQVDLDDNLALDFLKYFPQKYSNEKLCKLMDTFLERVRPLSCIAAEVIRSHQLPCECLPTELQYMVLQH
jgi:hypothetical protein